MRTAYLKLALAFAGSVPAAVLAQTTPPVPASAPETPAPKPGITNKTLFKLGTGLTRGFELNGYSGLTVPIVLGVERHLTPAVSVYGNLFGGLRADFDKAFLREIGVDAGVRYYYNQEKRKLKGRATGPFVGNYVALHTASSIYANHYQYSYNERYRYAYDYSNVNLLWGMQRRIGGHGLLDAYAGAGVSNNERYYYNNGYPSYKRQPTLNLQLGVKISLIP